MEPEQENQQPPNKTHEELRNAAASKQPDNSVLQAPRVHWFKPLMLAAGLFVLAFLLTIIVVDFKNARANKGDPIVKLLQGTDKQATVGKVNAGPRQTIPRLETNDDPYLGNKDASVIIVEFADFQCPFCKDFYPTFREVATQYGDRVKFIFRNFPLTELHDRAQAAAEAARCAFNQGNDKFWAYHDRLYQNQDNLSDANLRTLAIQVGLDEKAFDQCVKSGLSKAAVDEDYLDGVDAGVRGTPTLFFNGTYVQGVIPKDKFTQALDLMLH
jgi:protein-disulfide isomerase